MTGQCNLCSGTLPYPGRKFCLTCVPEWEGEQWAIKQYRDKPAAEPDSGVYRLGLYRDGDWR